MRALLNCTILLFLIGTALSWTSNPEAAVVGGDIDSSLMIKAVAHEKATQLPQVAYDLHVFNVVDANHQLYRLETVANDFDVRPFNSNKEIEPPASPLTEAETKILKARTATIATIAEDFWQALPDPLGLPKQFAYKSTKEALTYPADFAASLSHLLNARDLESKALLLQLNTEIEMIAAELNSHRYVVSVLADILQKPVPKQVQFRDGSLLEITLLLGYNLTDGLILEANPPQHQQSSTEKSTSHRP